jgi:SAM-dependent methyltransferase
MAYLNSKLIPHARGRQEFDNAYSDCAQYGNVNFWDERYVTETEPFEWYCSFDKIPTILEVMELDFNILIAGCGNSNILEEMAIGGYQKLVGIDFSRVVLNQMGVRCNDLPEISFVLGNVVDTDFPSEFFNGIIDKACFDAIICHEEGSSKATQYIDEVVRILTDTGIFILISHGNPEAILPYLWQVDIDLPYYTPWTVKVDAIGKFN